MKASSSQSSPPFWIKVLSGVHLGREAQVFHGLDIGRAKAHWIFDDPKMSSRHAVIESTPEGWEVRDLGSKNGLKFKGKKCQKILLADGTAFGIGTTSFRIEIRTQEESHVSPPNIEAPTIAGPATQKAGAPPPPPASDGQNLQLHRLSGAQTTQQPAEGLGPSQDERKTWTQILSEFFKAVATRIEDRPGVVVPLIPAVTLIFTEGLQAETVWTLGYGPRKVGAHSPDLPLLNSEAPPTAFELLPGPQGLLFKTGHTDKVLLNGEKKAVGLLRAGDKIRIGATLIEIEFEK